METISWDDFQKVELRIGTILEAHDFPKAKNPSYKVKADFGELGIKWSSAQITQNYQLAELPGRQIIAVLNFPPKNIAGFLSEFLITGFPDDQGNIVLASVEKYVPNGSRLI
ncbi:MAG: tRNA-binding protein [Daejeonella sp.]